MLIGDFSPSSYTSTRCVDPAQQPLEQSALMVPDQLPGGRISASLGRANEPSASRIPGPNHGGIVAHQSLCAAAAASQTPARPSGSQAPRPGPTASEDRAAITASICLAAKDIVAHLPGVAQADFRRLLWACQHVGVSPVSAMLLLQEKIAQQSDVSIGQVVDTAIRVIECTNSAPADAVRVAISEHTPRARMLRDNTSITSLGAGHSIESSSAEPYSAARDQPTVQRHSAVKGAIHGAVAPSQGGLMSAQDISAWFTKRGTTHGPV